jgi:hypothetical protein
MTDRRSALGWEFVTFSLPRGTTRAEARALLVSHADTGHWVLDRVRVYPDGRRRIRLRRRAMRLASPTTSV